MGTGNDRMLHSQEASCTGAGVHPLLQIPFVAEILDGFLPELQQHLANEKVLLDRISWYLFSETEETTSSLEAELSEACFLTLLGLKQQLCKYDLCEIAVAIALRKVQYQDWLQNM